MQIGTSSPRAIA